ncbi:unnamed protein product [Mytilus coruscus]|uniref:Apextrin C-terminal domain-containing protein n=1 Tax=Mytilus coruscus TaxID=42192 RepID=A0A6J8CV94_MYTCO|nr:unnamed protein product [Mytilus coruscus]
MILEEPCRMESMMMETQRYSTAAGKQRRRRPNKTNPAKKNWGCSLVTIFTVNLVGTQKHITVQRFVSRRKGGSCPKGFANGHVYSDDEDDSGSYNSLSGTLPDGAYGRNTVIQYCCRSDGPSNIAIELPTSKPFYLVRKSSACQQVKGMTVLNEYIRTDDEDDKGNENSWAGSYPSLEGGRNILIHYCYYA